MSFLAAAILYLLAIGDVEGLRTLGMSTVLDLVVVFLFTHPLMAVLARFVLQEQPDVRPRPGGALAGRWAREGPGTANSWVPAPPAPVRTGLLMTRPDTPAGTTPDADGVVPVGSDADEQQDADAVLARVVRRGGRGGARRRQTARGGSGQRVVPGSERRVSLSHRLYNSGEAGLDVVGHSRLIYKVTAVVDMLLLSIVFRGFNLGIEFSGGNAYQFPAAVELV